MISFYDVSTNVEGIIEKGPGEGATELEPYLQSLNQLAAAQKYFEEHIPQSVERENVVSIICTVMKLLPIFNFIVCRQHYLKKEAIK